MIEIDAQEAEARFGPRWEDVLKVISQAEALTFDQIARAPALDSMSAAAMLAAREAASATGRGDALAAAWDAALAAAVAGAAADAASWVAADADAWIVAVAAGEAAAAAVVSDQVDKHGLTAAHIAVLTQVWRVIIGAS